MKHGRVPIGDGAVYKEAVLVHGKSVSFKPINPGDYERVLKENEQLKQTNVILLEENSVNRDLIMTMYADFGKEPPAQLLRRLENIDARRQQTDGSPGRGSHSVDDRRRGEDTDESDDDDDSDYEGGDDDSDHKDSDNDSDHEGGDDDDVSFEGNGDGDPYLEGGADDEEAIEDEADGEEAVEGN
ncbi:hypothetical protein C2845_PM05G24110 [Panicum miliaceum]|uniref:Uncharacterized protein n=1 Tax=Panicum miliaceum TaxID=4540 RepID=A0A3L6SZ30_PANMI|nr:hypothetical protein C2845_PM05G24110 [Panicum miliaceum]